MPSRLADAERAAGAALLDLHEGIATDPLAGKCQRWPETLRLVNCSTGELLPGRCKSTNLCRYCQRLFVVETVEMLTLDAVEWAPTLWSVLTAREHLTRAEFNGHLKHIRRVLRRTWPGVEYFCQVEFQRRGALHGNLLWKGVPVAELFRLSEVVEREWCGRVDAEPWAQWAGAIADADGVVRYLSKMLAHGLKAEQAPPIGWRGHRTSQTRGYFVRPASVMREEARRALRVKRRIWKGDDATTAALEVAAAELHEWELRGLNPSTVNFARSERGPVQPAPAPRVSANSPMPAPQPTGARSSLGAVALHAAAPEDAQ